MDKLKRLPVKYIRDRAKSGYEKASICYICGTDKELQLHHFYSITNLWEKWTKQKSIKILNVDDILDYRDAFIEAHMVELYEEVVTLCKLHHMGRLHKVYGLSPLPHTAPKQKNWCEKQRIKFIGDLNASQK